MILIKIVYRKNRQFVSVNDIHHKINLRSHFDGYVNNNMIPYYWLVHELLLHRDELLQPYFKTK